MSPTPEFCLIWKFTKGITGYSSIWSSFPLVYLCSSALFLMYSFIFKHARGSSRWSYSPSSLIWKAKVQTCSLLWCPLLSPCCVHKQTEKQKTSCINIVENFLLARLPLTEMIQIENLLIVLLVCFIFTVFPIKKIGNWKKWLVILFLFWLLKKILKTICLVFLVLVLFWKMWEQMCQFIAEAT